MKKITLKVKFLKGKNQAQALPSKATNASAGFDLLASNDKPITIPPGKRAIIPTGIAIELPKGYEAQIRPRSGLALNYGITILNTPGTIDPDYRGEIKIILINLGDKPFTIKKQDRIAQMIISKLIPVKIQSVKQLSLTKRNQGGFGHTGINSAPNKKFDK